MVYHPISEWCGGDKSSLWLVNRKRYIRSWAIGLFLKFILKGQQIFFKPVLKNSYYWLSTFALAGFSRG
jgi:hypothetical protein